MNENWKITDEELENVNGGMVVFAQGLPEYDPAFPWEVVDNKACKCLGKFASRDGACAFAKSFGPEPYNAQEVDLATVNRLRTNPNVN